jgi:translation initiation factor 2B subunit (eIF-2B alpha/beta/delta family)
MTTEQRSQPYMTTLELENTIRVFAGEIRKNEELIESSRRKLEEQKKSRESLESDRKEMIDEIEKWKRDIDDRDNENEQMCLALVYSLSRMWASLIGACCKEHGLFIGFVKDGSRRIVIGIEGQATARHYAEECLTRRLERYLASVEPVEF